MTQGQVKEADLPGKGLETCGEIYDDHSLWYTSIPVHLLKVPWQGLLGGVRILDRSGTQPSDVTEEVGAAVLGVDQVG